VPVICQYHTDVAQSSGSRDSFELYEGWEEDRVPHLHKQGFGRTTGYSARWTPNSTMAVSSQLATCLQLLTGSLSLPQAH